MSAKDRLASIIAFVFSQDKKENMLPISQSNDLLNKIKQVLYSETQDNDKKTGEEK